MNNLICLCTVYILMLPFWISFECIFLDSRCSYIFLEDSLMSRNIRCLSLFLFPVYRYISVPVQVDIDVQLLIHGQYCRSCPVWDGVGDWAGHRPSTAPPPQRGQQTSPGVSKYLFTYRVSKSGCLLTMKWEGIYTSNTLVFECLWWSVYTGKIATCESFTLILQGIFNVNTSSLEKYVQYTWKQHFTWNSHKNFHVYFAFSECFS